MFLGPFWIGNNEILASIVDIELVNIPPYPVFFVDSLGESILAKLGSQSLSYCQRLKRMSVAGEQPLFSPILVAEVNLNRRRS